MTRSSLLRTLTLTVSLASVVALAGATLAASPPRSTNASSTAVTQVAAHGSDTADNAGDQPGQDAHALAVSTAAESDIVGGANQNHGGYVSCVARGGSDCTSTTPTLPSHGSTPTLPTQAQVPAR